jgi:N-acyl-D-amino-acid deacylase
MWDLLVRGGRIVDGHGGTPWVGDVAVSDGVIVAVGPQLDGDAAEVIDASGLVVAPGFVDIHTHYDGQATWDDVLEPSASHGVTTVVGGNCGVGFAPVRPGGEQALVELMEGVEDIPGTALHEGIEWQWETFPEFLDALGRRTWSMDIAVMVPHGPLRVYVMGDRGASNEDATAEDIAAMAQLVEEVLDLPHRAPPLEERRSGARDLRQPGRAVGHRPRGGPGRRPDVRGRPGRDREHRRVER